MRLGFFLPVTFGFLVFQLLGHISSWRVGAREKFLFALLGTSFFLVAMTEGLSFFHELTTMGVTALWFGGSLALLSIAAYLRVSLLPWSSWRPARNEFLAAHFLSRLLLVLIFIIVSMSGILAIFAAPNDWDSMTYHLPRVAHWLQNRSIACYATNCMYQNQHAPFAEWAMLHLALLQGNDHLSGLVQWIGLTGSIAAASLLAEACGGSRRAGVLAAFLVASMPMALLQASTAANDDVVSFFLVSLVFGCVRARKAGGAAWIAFTGAALGLSILTKTTAYLFAPFFMAWLALEYLQRGIGFGFPRLAGIGLIALVLNAGYYERNLQGSGTWLGRDDDSGPGFNYQNETHSPGAIFSNMLRNLSLQTSQIPALRNATAAAVRKTCHLLGIDPSDPRTTGYASHYYIPGRLISDQCADLWHSSLFLVCCGLLIFFLGRFGLDLQLLTLGIFVGAFLFCFVLKWQPFHARLHLPLLMLAMPVVAVVLDVLAFRLLTLIWVGCLIPLALSFVLFSQAQPLCGMKNIFHESRQDQRFFLRPLQQADNEEVLRLLEEQKIHLLGLIGPIDNSGWEYPLFDPDRMNFGYPWKIESVLVENSYSSLETDEVPDAVVLLEQGGVDEITIHGQLFHRLFQGQSLSLYGKEWEP